MTEELHEEPDVPAAAADPSGPDPADEVVPPEVAALAAERDDYRDRLLRTAAEFDNYRKRAERDRRDQADFATGELLVEILSLADDFDRALGVAGDGPADAYRKGVGLIHAKLHEILRRHGVRPIEAVGRTLIRTCTRRSCTSRATLIATAR
jgi:molecular chaperone GrpE